MSDLEAVVTASEVGGEIRFEARGRLLATATHKPVAGGEVRYSLKYTLSAEGVEIVARAGMGRRRERAGEVYFAGDLAE